MGSVDERLEELTRAVADADAPDREAIARARSRLLDAPPARRRRPATWILAAAAAAALVGLAWWASGPAEEPAPLAFEVDGARARQGEWLAAREAPLRVDFEEGTAIELQEAARARVEEVSANGARVRLENGTIDVDVVHRSDARWEILAGPYVVRVTGTRFDVTWDPAAEELELRMREGRVEVRGPMPMPREVTAGHVLHASADEVRVSRADAEEPAATEVEAQVEAEVASTAPEPSGAPDEPAAAPAPEALYREADRARFAGQPDRARRTLLRLRAAGERGRTAFLLGRLAAEASEDAEALRWFRTYLRERPRGSLAEPALGRVMELERRLEPDRAARTAGRYLRRYPRGAHARLARSLTSDP